MTLQINLNQIKADGALNSHVMVWSNTANAWVTSDVNGLVNFPVVPNANSTVSGIIKVVDSTTNTSTTVAASANSVTAAYDAAVTAQNMAASAYSNAIAVSATAYSNAVSYADTRAATAYANAIALSASNTYVNTQLGLKADLAGATFTGAVAVNNTLAAGNTTITGFANVTGTLQVEGNATISGNLIVNGTTITVNTSQINVTDSLLYLASNNEVSDTLDVGFAAHYNNGSGANGHTGFIRSAITKKYYLFQNYQPEFYGNNNVDVANTATGIQMADLVVGNLVANSTLIVTGNTTLNGSLQANAGILSANTIQFNDGSQQSTYIDPIAMAIALG